MQLIILARTFCDAYSFGDDGVIFAYFVTQCEAPLFWLRKKFDTIFLFVLFFIGEEGGKNNNWKNFLSIPIWKEYFNR